MSNAAATRELAEINAENMLASISSDTRADVALARATTALALIALAAHILEVQKL